MAVLLLYVSPTAGFASSTSTSSDRAETGTTSKEKLQSNVAILPSGRLMLIGRVVDGDKDV
jgi:hypothetical protein